MKELEDGLTELDEQGNELKTAKEEEKVNFEKLCKARYKTPDDKLLYAEVYSRGENLRFYGIREETGRLAQSSNIFLGEQT